MTGAEAVPTLLADVHELTGYDAAALPGTGVATAVFGVGSTGVTSLVEACRRADPAAQIAEGRWGRGPDDAAIGIALMVVDPTSSVGQQERRALDELRSRFGVVALVCTKIDAFWDWPRILRTHRSVLDPHELLPVFAVSATVGAGIPAILEWIADQVSESVEVRQERAQLAAALGAIEHMVGGPEDPMGSGTQTDVLARRRRFLVESRDRGRGDRLAAGRAGLARARGRSLAEVATGARALATAGVARCAALRSGEVAAHAEWMSAQATALRDQVDAATEERIEQVRATTLVGIDGHDAAADLDAQAARPEPAPEPPFSRELPGPRGGAEGALLMLIGASTGVGVGRLIVAPMASVQTLQWISMPLTLLLGLAVAVWVTRVRRTATLRADMRAWTTDVVAETRSRLDHRVTSRVAAAEAPLAGQVARHYERRARHTVDAVEEIDNQMRELRSGSADADHRARLARMHGLRRDLLARARADKLAQMRKDG